MEGKGAKEWGGGAVVFWIHVWGLKSVDSNCTIANSIQGESADASSGALLPASCSSVAYLWT